MCVHTKPIVERGMLGILCVTCVQDDFLNNGVSIDTVLKHTCVPVALRRRFGRGGERKDTLDIDILVQHYTLRTTYYLLKV